MAVTSRAHSHVRRRQNNRRPWAARGTRGGVCVASLEAQNGRKDVRWARAGDRTSGASRRASPLSRTVATDPASNPHAKRTNAELVTRIAQTQPRARRPAAAPRPSPSLNLYNAAHFSTTATHYTQKKTTRYLQTKQLRFNIERNGGWDKNSSRGRR